MHLLSLLCALKNPGELLALRQNWGHPKELAQNSAEGNSQNSLMKLLTP
jgi:hypothetical protein